MSLNKAATISASRDLPPGLVVAVQNQRVVMFLGAGASLEARGPNNAKPPSAGDLRTALARHSFDDPLDGYDLMSVASMAIQQAGQGAVFERVRALLEPFNPSPAHQLLPRFHWRQIATTNYDLLIERAYASCANPVQEIVPLVLSHEHYSLYERNRNRLFDRLGPVTAKLGRVARISGAGAMPPSRLGSGDAERDRASQIQHAVQRMDGDVHLRRATLVRARAQSVTDHLLEPADGGFDPGTGVVS